MKQTPKKKTVKSSTKVTEVKTVKSPIYLGMWVVVLFVAAILGAAYMMNKPGQNVTTEMTVTPVATKTTIATLHNGLMTFAFVAPENIVIKNENGGGCTDPKDTDCKNTWISASVDGKMFMEIEAPSVTVLNAYSAMTPVSTNNVGNLYRATLKVGEDPNLGYSTFKTVYLSEKSGKMSDKCFNQEGKVVSAPCGMSGYGASTPDEGKDLAGGYFTAACAADDASVKLCDTVMKGLQFNVE